MNEQLVGQRVLAYYEDGWLVGMLAYITAAQGTVINENVGTFKVDHKNIYEIIGKKIKIPSGDYSCLNVTGQDIEEIDCEGCSFRVDFQTKESSVKKIVWPDKVGDNFADTSWGIFDVSGTEIGVIHARNMVVNGEFECRYNMIDSYMNLPTVNGSLIVWYESTHVMHCPVLIPFARGCEAFHIKNEDDSEGNGHFHTVRSPGLSLFRNKLSLIQSRQKYYAIME